MRGGFCSALLCEAQGEHARPRRVLRDERVVVVDLDGRFPNTAGGIHFVEQFEELDELTAAMAILDQGVNLTSEEIDPSQ